MDNAFLPLARARAYRVTEIWRPQAPGDQQAGLRGKAQHAALAAAYHAGISGAAGSTVAFGWIRTEAGGPVHILTVGDALVGSADARGGEVLLSLPSGARGTLLRAAEFSWLTGQLGCWRQVGGISDPLLAAGSACGGRPGFALEDGLLGNWTGPFGWLVVAEPVGRGELQVLLKDVGERQRAAEGAADRFAGQAALARRLAERHAELQRGESAGVWRVRVLAGGTDEPGAARVAGLVCASADLDGLPYALTPAPVAAVPGAGGDGTASSPFYASTALLAALARAPESEVPGVRLALRPEFDVTPELPASARGAEVGRVLDRDLTPGGAFMLSPESLNRHVLVCGATGGGKSQTVRGLLEAAAGLGIPWLVVEPAKAEYRLMAARLPGHEVIRIRLGEADAVAAGLNPLEPSIGPGGERFPLQAHADLVRALFIASFQAEEPFPQVLAQALTRVYEDAGWDLALGEPRHEGTEPGYPALSGLERAAEQVVKDVGYSPRVTEDVLGFIRVRVASLRHGTTGRFLEGGHPLDFGALLRKNVVLELEDVGDDTDKAFLMGTVLIRLAEHLRLAHSGTRSGLRHLTVIEEAHRLLGQPRGGGAAGHAVELFAGLLAEVRAYGEGLVIAEQIPSRLVPDVIKNTAVKIVHRLPAIDDRHAVGATVNATEAQSRYLVTLRPGQAAAFADGMDYPVLIQVKDGTRREQAKGVTRDAAGLVRPRSVNCGAECAVRACTLRETRRAQQLVEDQPWTGLWAHLTVLGHLTGWPSPVPVADRLAAFRALPPRTSQCAMSHAVDAAVALHPRIGRPAGLAVHAYESMRARAEDEAWFCDVDEPQWMIPDLGELPPALAQAIGRDQGSAGGPLASFIDCQWPLLFLPSAQAQG